MNLTLCPDEMKKIALNYAANNLHLTGRFNVATPQPDGSFVLTWDQAAVVVKRRWWQRVDEPDFDARERAMADRLFPESAKPIKPKPPAPAPAGKRDLDLSDPGPLPA